MVQVKKAEIRDAILDAAARLFEEKGYVGTSMTEIGQAAGVAPSGIYIYFKSKLDLFYTIFSPWLKSRLERLDRELKKIDGHRARVRRIVEAIWLDIPRESNFFANNLIQAVSTATQADFYSGELLEWCEQRVARMLKAVEPRTLQSQHDHASLAHILFMSFNGFVAGAYLGVRAEKIIPAIDAMTDLIMAPTPPHLVASND